MVKVSFHLSFLAFFERLTRNYFSSFLVLFFDWVRLQLEKGKEHEPREYSVDAHDAVVDEVVTLLLEEGLSTDKEEAGNVLNESHQAERNECIFKLEPTDAPNEVVHSTVLHPPDKVQGHSSPHVKLILVSVPEEETETKQHFQNLNEDDLFGAEFVLQITIEDATSSFSSSKRDHSECALLEVFFLVFRVMAFHTHGQ